MCESCSLLMVLYLDHGVQRAGKLPPELGSDVHHVHLATRHHHSDQGVVVSARSLQRTHKHNPDKHKHNL